MRKALKAVTGTIALVAASMLAARAEVPMEPGFPAGMRLAAEARGEAAIAALGNRLPEVAAFYGKSPQQLRKSFQTDDSLWVNPEGQLFYACDLQCADCGHAETAEVAAKSIAPTDPSPYDTSEAFLLHSRPGARRVIHLDFDGHTDNTPGFWKAGAASPAYNISGNNPAIFEDDERNHIIEIWQRVAEDYAMFDIDVTTTRRGTGSFAPQAVSHRTRAQVHRGGQEIPRRNWILL